MPSQIRSDPINSSRYFSPKRVGALQRQANWRKRSADWSQVMSGGSTGVSRSTIAEASAANGSRSLFLIGQPLRGIQGRASKSVASSVRHLPSQCPVVPPR